MLDLPLEELVRQIKSQTITAQSLMSVIYDNIDRHESTLHAFRAVLPREKAMEQAEALDKRVQNGEAVGRLAGIPVSIKDNICLKDSGMTTTCGSKMLENFDAPYNATAVDKLLAEDAIIIGKTNMDEYAMGSSTENSAYGATKNPWNTDCVPGGSSGGSAVVVAAGMSVLTLGSDTGGSIRQPASFCGVSGMKPTYGRVSRFGLVAYGSSLDQIGCLAKSAEDCAYGISVIHGYDERDSTSAKVDAIEIPQSVDLSKMKFCVPSEYINSDALDAEVRTSLQDTIALLKNAGATVEERSLPSTQYLIPTYYIIAFAEASSNLGRFDGVRYGLREQEEPTLDSLYKSSRSQGFGTEVKRRIMLGTFVLSAGYYDAYYGKAGKVRSLIESEMETLLTEFDYLLGPVSPIPPFQLGEKTEDPLSMYLADLYSVLANLARMPAMAIPGKMSESGLPIGVQLMGAKFSDGPLMATAAAIQKLSDYHQERPSLWNS